MSDCMDTFLSTVLAFFSIATLSWGTEMRRVRLEDAEGENSHRKLSGHILQIAC